MKAPTFFAVALAAVFLSATHAAQVLAAPKKPAKAVSKSKAAKPAAKPKERKLIREVMGTEQIAGWEGALNEAFTIGTNPAVNFSLRRAEYSAGRVNIGGNAHIPKGDEKLLVLHFTIQNPQPKPLNFGGNYLIIRAVDSGGVTRDFVGDLAREVTGERLSLTLSPGQKVDGYTAVRVAAWGEVPKLIVQSWYDRKAPIVRYDLRGKVQKLAAPFADAKDAANALKLVPAKAGAFFPVTDNFDARLDAIAYSAEPIMGQAPKKGSRYCVATFTIQNKGLKPNRLSYSYFRADLKDADGEKTDYNSAMLKGSRDEAAGSELAPGEEARVRFYWALPEKVEAKEVLLQYGYDRESRTFAFDAASAIK
jgi:hypothetical protein